ncbi:MAG: hypothetical protein ACTH0S_11755, partial [Senegalia sp. (in: firmicutes)]
VMSVAERLRKEGEERGIEIGEERGAKKERIKLAKDMIENSEPLEKIIQYTKLDIKEIEIIKLQMDN